MKVDSNGVRQIANFKTKHGKSVNVQLKVNKGDGQIQLMANTSQLMANTSMAALILVGFRI